MWRAFIMETKYSSPLQPSQQRRRRLHTAEHVRSWSMSIHAHSISRLQMQDERSTRARKRLFPCTSAGNLAIWTRSMSWRSAITSGLLKMRPMRFPPHTGALASELSVSLPPSAFTLPRLSPLAKEEWLPPAIASMRNDYNGCANTASIEMHGGVAIQKRRGTTKSSTQATNTTSPTCRQLSGLFNYVSAILCGALDLELQNATTTHLDVQKLCRYPRSLATERHRGISTHCTCNRDTCESTVTSLFLS